MNRKLVLSTLCILPLVSYATIAKDADKPAFTSSAELGFLYKTGNTKSADVKAGLSARYEKEQWLTSASFNVLAKKLETENEDGDKEFVSTDNKWDIATQTNYTLTKEGKNYLYGNLAYEQDKFSGFKSQSSFSAGWGRQWHKTKTSSFFADIGPGVKYDVVRGTAAIPEESTSSLIVQAQALYTTKINDYVEFKQYFVAKQATKSDDNSVYKSETSITTKLIESLQLKFSLRIDYDTEVAEGFENTNTETSMTLVYSF